MAQILKLSAVGLLAAGLFLIAWKGAPHAPVGQGRASVRSARPTPTLADQCNETAQWLQWQLGSSGRVLVRPPLVLGGDLEAAELDRWHREVLQPAAEALAANYFTVRPNGPVVAILMAGPESYRAVARRLFADAEISSYGYFKPHLRTLVADVSRGPSGALHELAHALASFDFPAAPVWLAEGLASLMEDCRIQRDPPRMEPRVNWRLGVLREAVARGRLPGLADLVARRDFDGPDRALCYAQARYFCLDLERRGLLGELYRRVRDGHATDPSGAATIAAVTGRSWEQLDADFRHFVRSLSPD